TTDGAPAAIVLNDHGKAESAAHVSERINQGQQVVALDLAFLGDAWQKSGGWPYEQMLNGIGDRPLGMEAAQLIAVARWLKSPGSGKVALDTTGIRSQTIALVAAALEPDLFDSVITYKGMRSLSFLLEQPVEYSEAHDLFCLDLFKYFDIDRLAKLATNVSIRQVNLQ